MVVKRVDKPDGRFGGVNVNLTREETRLVAVALTDYATAKDKPYKSAAKVIAEALFEKITDL